MAERKPYSKPGVTWEAKACDCGAPIPMHLFDLVAEGEAFSHVCSCERRWVKRGGKIVQDGYEKNPLV